jgi:hypothetical protein
MSCLNLVLSHHHGVCRVSSLVADHTCEFETWPFLIGKSPFATKLEKLSHGQHNIDFESINGLELFETSDVTHYLLKWIGSPIKS